MWHDGEPELVSQYWVAGTKRTVAPLVRGTATQMVEDDRLDRQPEPQTTDGPPSFPRYVAIGLFALAVLLTATLIRAEIHFARLEDSQDRPGSGAVVARTPPQAPSPPIAEPDTREIEERMAQHGLLSGLSIGITRRGGHVWCSGAVYTQRQQELLTQLVSACTGVDSVDVRQVLVTHQYTVSEGDTFEEIARKVYGNPGMWGWIFRANEWRMADPSVMRPSMMLTIPEAPDLLPVIPRPNERPSQDTSKP